MTDFTVASSAGKQKIETSGGWQKKENRIQKFEVESRKSFFCVQVGRAKQRSSAVG